MSEAAEQSSETATPARKLKPRHRQFALEYLDCLNATEAYRRVYPACTNPDVAGPRLLGTDGVRALVDAKLQKLEERKFLDVARLEEELDAMALFDPKDTVDENDRILSLHQMPERARRAIASMENEELFDGVGRERVAIGTLRKIKVFNKVDAIRLGLQRRGALVERHELNLPPALTFKIIGPKGRK